MPLRPHLAPRLHPHATHAVFAALKRELSRDAAFMGEVRRKEKDRKATARDKSAKRAMAFLEQQEADFKSGGQGGMNPHKKKQK